jgi:hypothetical protein
MFELLRHTLRNQLLPQQLLSGGTAFLIANEFYKFRSFGLECLAFLVTWGVIDFIVDRVVRFFKGKRKP